MYTMLILLLFDIAWIFLNLISLSCGLSTIIDNGRIDKIAPERSKEWIDEVSEVVSHSLIKEPADSSSENRYNEIRSLASDFQKKANSESNKNVTDYQMVYGELGIQTLATILDAVGMREEGEHFLDIGSGDGALVIGAALLYGSTYIKKSRGLEIIPGLISRSNRNLHNFYKMMNDEDREYDCIRSSEIEFLLGDVHDSKYDFTIREVLKDTTIAVCFATTWSAGNVDSKAKDTSLQQRQLPKLSSALSLVPVGTRIVVIDGKLDCNDGYVWRGDLKIFCANTAPYSVASLYQRQ